MVSGTSVADSRHAQLVYLPPPLNAYACPRDDVRWDLLSESKSGLNMPGLGEVQHWSVVVNEHVREGAAWTFPGPPPDLDALTGLVVLRWHLMDAWFEEDDEVFVHPRDPYHRVDVLNSSRQVAGTVGGKLGAATRARRLLFETSLPVRYYIPMLDVRTELLEPSPTITRCPYKRVPSYWSLHPGATTPPTPPWP